MHEVRIKGGKRLETHLCEACAREQGVSVQAATPITQLLTQYITSQSRDEGGEGGAAPATLAPTICPACATTYAQFRTSGLLGCPTCYATFEAQLGPLLARAHEGGDCHAGKRPASMGPPGAAMKPQTMPASPAASPPPDPAAGLRARLAVAVENEQYEEAARLRDEIARLEATPKPTRTRRPNRPPGGEERA